MHNPPALYISDSESRFGSFLGMPSLLSLTSEIPLNIQVERKVFQLKLQPRYTRVQLLQRKLCHCLIKQPLVRKPLEDHYDECWFAMPTIALQRFNKEFSNLYLKYIDDRKKKKRIIKGLKLHVKKEMKL
jgi:hypothetical protein